MADVSGGQASSTWSYFLVGNIPPAFHSADLRCHFSHYVEGKYFKCFHYRHRPEESPGVEHFESAAVVTATPSEPSKNKRTKKLTHCCVVALYNDKGMEFMGKCSGKNWSKNDGGLLPSRVRISKLNVTTSESKSIRIT